ncbi:MAG: zinc ribbon domain-containing protein, partial [Verrucomicrobia bacterium]|nr:zinc ribbon domain-containing protein [Verrucomicrobiota bacterium]
AAHAPPVYPHNIDSQHRVRESYWQTIVTMPNIPFTDNYTDLSSQRGFQFKFSCEKCGNGYMSTFRANKPGVAAAAADVAGSLLGGIFGRAAQTAQSLQSMAAGPQHDSALEAAVKEISPLFKQCTRCGKWVCEPVCWNKKAGLCENCAPDLDEEIAAAQAAAAKEQIVEKVRQVDYLAQRDLAQVAPALCPKCGAKTQGCKFCPDCGAAISAKKKCAHCGAEADGTPKFCPECGKAYGG